MKWLFLFIHRYLIYYVIKLLYSSNSIRSNLRIYKITSVTNISRIKKMILILPKLIKINRIWLMATLNHVQVVALFTGRCNTALIKSFGINFGEYGTHCFYRKCWKPLVCTLKILHIQMLLIEYLYMINDVF